MQGGPAPKDSPIPTDQLGACERSMVIMDTVYTPLQTPLLKAARAAGLRTIDGASLFVRQAEAQFNLWTGGPPPGGLFDRLVRERAAKAEGAL
jgi:shikimate 5-dehydrogenase